MKQEFVTHVELPSKRKNKLEKREEELVALLDKHRSGNGEYDCLVPGSGEKTQHIKHIY